MLRTMRSTMHYSLALLLCAALHLANTFYCADRGVCDCVIMSGGKFGATCDSPESVVFDEAFLDSIGTITIVNADRVCSEVMATYPQVVVNCKDG